MTEQVYRSEVLLNLKNQSFDLALNSVYSREQALDCLATEIGARQQVALKHGARPDLGYSHLIDSPGKWKLELDRHKDFLQSLGIALDHLEPIVWTTREDEAWADDFFRQHNLKSVTTFALFAGALSEHRYYRHYGQALDRVLNKSSYAVIALGAARDQAINQQNFKNITGTVIDATSATTLGQTAAILRRCRLGLGAETGLAHMACAVGLPHVIVLGGGHFGRFMPYSPLTSAVILPLACYGCDWQCRYKKAYCIQDIDPAVIALAIQETLTTSVDKPRLFIQKASQYHRAWFGPQWKAQYETYHHSLVQQQRESI